MKATIVEEVAADTEPADAVPENVAEEADEVDAVHGPGEVAQELPLLRLPPGQHQSKSRLGRLPSTEGEGMPGRGGQTARPCPEPAGWSGIEP